MEFTIANQFFSVAISSTGASIMSIKSFDGTEYFWQGDPAYWSGRDLNPFPYVARLTDGKYTLDGHEYKMNIHGIAPTSEFKPVEHTERLLILEMTSTPDTFRQYPRSFSFSIVFEVIDNALVKTFIVNNLDSQDMYFGLGGHPGFNVPLKKGLAFSDYYLHFIPELPVSEKQPDLGIKQVLFTEDCFVEGSLQPFDRLVNGKLYLNHELFDHDAIVLTNIPKTVVLGSDIDERSVTVEFPQMTYLGLWHTPKTDAPYVCIEPWCTLPSRKGIVEAFETQPGLLHLKSGEQYVNTWKIIIS